MENERVHTSRPADQALKRRVLLATILGSGLVFLDSSVANVALRAIQRDFGISTATQQWVASSYLLTLSVLLLVGGRLADIFGRKRMFTIGLTGYVLLSLAAALASSAAWLITARALQGVAGAMLVPTTLALINATFPPSERGRAIGTWAAWSGIATVFGPIVGGFAIDNLSWRYAFVLAPVMAIGALIASGRIPESRDPSGDRGIDYVGSLLVVGSFGGFVFALIQGPIFGWDAPLVVGTALVGAVLFPIFLWWETRAKSPVMPYAMFENRNLAVANVVTLFVYAGLYGMTFYVPLYAQTAMGTTATVAASTFIPVTVILFFLSPLAGRLNDRFGPRWLMCAGPLVASLGIALAGLTGPGQLYTRLFPGIIVFGLGLGFTVTPVTATAIGSAEERFSGIASGFNNAVSRLAGLLAIAAMGVIVVQLWQGALLSAAVQATPRVAQALGTVSNTAFVSPTTTGLSASDARAARVVAEAASQTAFRNGMLLAAALVAVGGVVSGAFIRHVRPESEPR